MKKGGSGIERERLELLRQVAEGIAGQFGGSCEVVVHDLGRGPDHSIAAIVNGHVTGRKEGDGVSRMVLERLHGNEWSARDHMCCLTQMPDGKLLKSSAVYIRDGQGTVEAILAINYDVSRLMVAEGAIEELISTRESRPAEPESALNISDLLEKLIQQSVALVGKPVAMMSKEDKVRAIRFLSQNGAFLVTKSSDKIAKYFGISKYTLYSYIDMKDMKQQEGKHHD